MYLRHPWVVGQAGVLGALIIVLIAVGITGCTALSMSSITTNIRIGAGGPFSIISQSLGLEMGGSIGVPLYFSQACAMAMYVFGFREGWLSIFPEQFPYALLIDIIIFLILWAITAISTNFAFNVQYIMMALIVGSIFSILGGLYHVDMAEALKNISLFGNNPGVYDSNNGSFSDGSFWITFAVFFPAVTGVMAGANMSGDLEKPRKNIPWGTLSAVIVTAVIYIGLIFVAALLATPEEMTVNYNIFIEKSYWPPIVIAGLLGATFSSALGSFVGAPRILMALGQFNILPGSKYFRKVTKRGEPRNAYIMTAIVVLISLLARDLNVLAPLITMFFLITYAMINIVVLLEQGLSLPGFRPALRIPIFVPLIGSIGCLAIMFIINPIISFVSIAVVLAAYGMLMNQKLVAKKGDVRSGLFTALAEWATKQSNVVTPVRSPRVWQPELLVPASDAEDMKGLFRLIHAIVRPRGTLKILGLCQNEKSNEEAEKFRLLVNTFNQVKISAAYSIIEDERFDHAVNISMQAMGALSLRPNTILLPYKADKLSEYRSIVEQSQRFNWALMLYVPSPNMGLGIENTINIWLSEISPLWEENVNLGDNDLATLIGILISRNWKNARINLISFIPQNNPEAKLERLRLLSQIGELARMPKNTHFYALFKTNADQETIWEKAPIADLNIISFDYIEQDISIAAEICKTLNCSCLFTLDSTLENVLV